jgi:LytS/YehU family sensor histidine kinase
MMHPPFLFHALQSIADLLDKNQNEKADHILTTLSHLLRKTVYEIESDEKTLEEELSSLHDYLEIENVRFGGTLLWTENLEDGVSHAIIPNFLLQPFLEGYIEDAWCHRSSVHTIRLTGKKLSEQLSLSLKGDGASVLRNEDEQRNYDAVFSVMAERLCQLYHDKCLFQNIRHADGTISVEIRIPYQDRHVLLEQTSEVENPL